MAAQRARAPWVLAFCAGGALFGCSLVLPFDEDKLTGGAAGSGGAGTGGVSSAGSPSSSGQGTTSASAGGSGVTSSASSGGATSSSASSGGASNVSSSASTGGGGSGVTVQCGQPTPVDCMPGQVCCYDLTSPYNDFCAPSGDCGPTMEYGELTCEGPEDCGGQPCCALFELDMTDIKATYCDTACDIEKLELSSCLTDADCGQGTTCQTPLGQEYTTYHFCVF